MVLGVICKKSFMREADGRMLFSLPEMLYLP